MNNRKLDSLGFLRGVAVIAVCFCHFADPLSYGSVFSGIFRVFKDYGANGIIVFFVISGFVIPLSLSRGEYRIHDYFRFLYKRLLRLQPPYLAALALTLFIIFLSYKVRHQVFPETFTSIIQSIFYFHIPSDNPVFWTLVVEAQFYLFIGIFYATLMQAPKLAFCIFLPVLLFCSQWHVTHLINIFYYITFFLIGTWGFLIYSGQENRILNLTGFGLLIVFSFTFYHIEASVASLLTIMFILLYRGHIASWMQLPGRISYSVYLIHFPIGIKLVNLLKPRISPLYYAELFIFTLIVVFIVSYFFYKIFEDPSEALSRRIKYSRSTILMDLATISGSVTAPPVDFKD